MTSSRNRVRQLRSAYFACGISRSTSTSRSAASPRSTMQAEHTSDQQTRRRDNSDRKRNLCHDQSPATVSGCGAGRSTSATSQVGRRSVLTDNSAGARPESSAVTNAIAPVNNTTVASIRIDSTRGSPSGTDGDQRLETPPRDDQPRSASRDCQHHAFGDQLTDNPASSRPKRGACTASSPRRASPRIKHRFATFALAISITRPTAPNSAMIAVRISPTTTSGKERTTA